MKIHVGSQNEVKIQAVTEVVAGYSLFKDAEIASVAVNIELFGHPKDLEAVVEGAIARAQEAFPGCDYSFGIEGGLMSVPRSKTGYMEVTACAIYDGKEVHLGLSPAFEWPKQVVQLIFKGLDGSQALREAGITVHPKIGTAKGGIWHLTEGRMDRKEYTRAAIVMALIHLEHPEYF